MKIRTQTSLAKTDCFGLANIGDSPLVNRPKLHSATTLLIVIMVTCGYVASASAACVSAASHIPDAWCQSVKWAQDYVDSGLCQRDDLPKEPDAPEAQVDAPLETENIEEEQEPGPGGSESRGEPVDVDVRQNEPEAVPVEQPAESEQSVETPELVKIRRHVLDQDLDQNALCESGEQILRTETVSGDPCTAQYKGGGAGFCNEPESCVDPETCAECTYDAERDKCFTEGLNPDQVKDEVVVSCLVEAVACAQSAGKGGGPQTAERSCEDEVSSANQAKTKALDDLSVARAAKDSCDAGLSAANQAKVKALDDLSIAQAARERSIADLAVAQEEKTKAVAAAALKKAAMEQAVADTKTCETNRASLAGAKDAAIAKSEQCASDLSASRVQINGLTEARDKAVAAARPLSGCICDGGKLLGQCNLTQKRLAGDCINISKPLVEVPFCEVQEVTAKVFPPCPAGDNVCAMNQMFQTMGEQISIHGQARSALQRCADGLTRGVNIRAAERMNQMSRLLDAEIVMRKITDGNGNLLDKFVPDCGAGFFFSAAANECRQATACSAGTLEFRAPGRQTDRVCRPACGDDSSPKIRGLVNGDCVPGCGAHQNDVSEGPILKCENKCNDDQFFDLNDGACKALTVCAADERVGGRHSATRDRTCRPAIRVFNWNGLKHFALGYCGEVALANPGVTFAGLTPAEVIRLNDRANREFARLAKYGAFARAVVEEGRAEGVIAGEAFAASGIEPAKFAEQCAASLQ